MWLTRWLRTEWRGNEWGIDAANMGRVADGIYRGADPSVRAMAQLYHRLGVKTVIDLRDGLSARERAEKEDWCRAIGIEPLFYPFADKGDGQVEGARVRRVLALIGDANLRPLYIHCRGGRHRTGGAIAAYRVTVDGWTVERAYEEAKAFGFYSAFGHELWKRFILGLPESLDRC